NLHQGGSATPSNKSGTQRYSFFGPQGQTVGPGHGLYPDQTIGPKNRSEKKYIPSYPQTFLRHPSTGERTGPTGHPTNVGPPEHYHHRNLYAPGPDPSRPGPE